MDVPVLNMQGDEVGTMSIDTEALGGEVNAPLIKQAYVRYHANRRQGSARTKSRGMIEGSTRKLYKQKGTGRARMGAVRTNIRRGGGRTFAKTKTRESYRLDMPIKMRRKANRNALLAKLLDNEVRVIDELRLDEPKTKGVKSMLDALGIDRSCLLATRADNANVRLGARNLEGVLLCSSDQVTCFEMLNCRFMIISKADLEQWLDRSSGTAKGGKERMSSKRREPAASGGEAA